MELGVCYYPEHWPESRWTEDARQMRMLGISHVRLGEFAWSRLEPRPGHYAWDWLDRAIETLGAAGLKIILGTPTATPPKWLIDRHPDILAHDAEGRPRGFGSRRHYCFSSPTYRRAALRIVTDMARRYGHNPHVVAWQTDNEYGCHDTVVSYSPAAQAAFRDWLRARYGDPQRLNDAWGAVFWSMELTDFDQADPPNLTVTEANPAHRLDYWRFSSDQVAAFNRAQVEILRRESPGRDLVHNFMGFEESFDHFAVARDLDVASWDSYPLGFLDQGWFDGEEKARYLRQGHPDFAAFHHDLYRAMCGGRLWVMEQQPGPVNWAPHNPAPLPGMVRLWSWEAFAHGAELVSYFRWRQAPFAQEQMHAGLLRPDGAPAPAAAEAAQVAREIAAIPATGSRQAPVALLFDYQTLWTVTIQPQGREFRALRLIYEVYSALRRRGLDVDMVAPEGDLDGFAAVVVPIATQISADLAQRLAAFDGQVLIGPRSGSKTADYAIPTDLPPGRLGDRLGVRVTGVESLPAGHRETVIYQDITAPAWLWREHLETGADTEILGRFADPFAADSPAVTRRAGAWYLACWPQEALMDAVIGDFCQAAGLEILAPLGDLRLRRRGQVRFAFNYGPGPVTVPLPDGVRPLLGGRQLAAAGVAAWQEE